MGIRATARLIDFSGYWIMLVSVLISLSLIGFAPALELSRLVLFENYSGSSGADVWPHSEQLWFVFALSALLPAYTITGFDASAHAAEETIAAAKRVPHGIVRSVVVSGVAGWILLSAVVISAPSLPEAARQGEQSFLWILGQVLPGPLATCLVAGIVVAQYFCGLATVTSASRMAYAFARDGGLPFSAAVRWVCPRRQAPVVSIWTVSTAAVLFSLYTPAYATITAVCTILLYVSYVLPTALGAREYGRGWTSMGPWQLGKSFQPLAWISVLGCVALIAIGVQPPNQRALWVLGGFAITLSVLWILLERKRYPGPPRLAHIAGGALTQPGGRMARVKE
jgi:amino acid transporter